MDGAWGSKRPQKSPKTTSPIWQDVAAWVAAQALSSDSSDSSSMLDDDSGALGVALGGAGMGAVFSSMRQSLHVLHCSSPPHAKASEEARRRSTCASTRSMQTLSCWQLAASHSASSQWKA